MSYRKLGDLVKFVSNKNIDGNATVLFGINIDKFFMPSVANIIGVDLKKYKVVERHQFACNRMHVGRDKRLPISMSTFDYYFIVSPAYDVFEVITSDVLPEYLMLWFRRKEFDRQCWFYTDADVRGGLHLDALKSIEIKVPSIEEQRQIVEQYQSVANKIKVNEQICEKLEATAQALYKHWFVDFEFPYSPPSEGCPQDGVVTGKPYKSSGGKMVWNEELGKEIPEGWEVVKVKDFCDEMKSGGTPSRDNLSFWNSNDIPWLKTGEISNNVVFDAEEYISKEGYKNSSARLIPAESILMAMYGATAGQLTYLKKELTTNQACCAMICFEKERSAFLYYALLNQQKQIETLAIGGAQPNLSKQIIEKINLILPKDLKVISFFKFSHIIDLKAYKTLENIKLTQLQSLLLSRLAVDLK